MWIIIYNLYKDARSAVKLQGDIKTIPSGAGCTSGWNSEYRFLQGATMVSLIALRLQKMPQELDPSFVLLLLVLMILWWRQIILKFSSHYWILVWITARWKDIYFSLLKASLLKYLTN